jgi:CO/xanthine dehydrogenase Mo-binding subunit
LSLSRRDLLRRLGWTAVGTTAVAVTGCGILPPLPSRIDSNGEDAVLWLQLREDGRLVLAEPRAEIGQDAGTALLQVAAEHLGVPIDALDLERPHTDAIGMVRSTVGSESMALFAPLVAGAASALRGVLLARAATRLDAPVGTLSTERTGIVSETGGRLAWSELATPVLVVDGAPAPLPVGGTGGPVGRDVPSRDLPALLEAAPRFASDVRLPGMLHARILRPPRAGATPVAVRLAQPLPADVGLHRDGDLVALLAPRSGPLPEAAGRVEVRWSDAPALDTDALLRDLDVDRRLAAGDLEHVLEDDRFEPGEPWTVDLRLSVPFAAHAFLEPRCAVARWHGDRLELWTGTQDAFYVRASLARGLSVPEADVRVHPMRAGGAFGGRTLCTVELEAARLARALHAPVRVQWTREDEFSHGFHRPPSEHRLRARLGPDGRIRDWWHAFTSGHVIFTSAAMPRWMQTATSLVPDPGVGRGAVPPWTAERRRVEFTDVRLPVPTGPWRGLGAAPNGIAGELLMDALADAAGCDPIRFRLAHRPASRDRLATCLRRLARLMQSRPPGPGAARGIAAAIYKAASFVAVGAEVRREDGRLRVDRMWCVQDCGRAINPDRVRAQVEGNLVWAVGTALREDLAIGPQGPVARQFDGYALPRWRMIPPMEIELVEGSPAPAGAAETAIAAAPAAIVNAVRRLDGHTPDRVPLVS